MDVKLIRSSTLMMEAACLFEVPTFLPDVQVSYPKTQLFYIHEILLQRAISYIKVRS